MRQRVMIAMMLLNQPELLIADEPTTALDVTIQAQILDLLRALQRDHGTAITLITHDLGVVAGMADHVLVMYSGTTMEAAPTEALFARPSHPYTLGLLRSRPRVDASEHARLYAIPGRPPDLHERPPGCPFAPRCTFVRDLCHTTAPQHVTIGPGHTSACHATDEVQALVATGRHLDVDGGNP
jgi:oligopeptide/dipeptide ABC transporter ATP-binding protein